MDDYALNCCSIVQILRGTAMYAVNILRDSLQDGASREVSVKHSLFEQTFPGFCTEQFSDE
jgi:hypothetical protein